MHINLRFGEQRKKKKDKLHYYTCTYTTHICLYTPRTQSTGGFKSPLENTLKTYDFLMFLFLMLFKFLHTFIYRCFFIFLSQCLVGFLASITGI